MAENYSRVNVMPDELDAVMWQMEVDSDIDKAYDRLFAKDGLITKLLDGDRLKRLATWEFERHAKNCTPPLPPSLLLPPRRAVLQMPRHRVCCTSNHHQASRCRSPNLVTPQVGSPTA